ncbi:hypothetical protein ACTQ46_01590 [Gallicola sp. Sow4_E12]|uniref:hypothetical protein n=1 Tax=Gallicola sp. Sow4_E12 TaxID=3438785 RepID=UPI003F8F73C9
MRKRNKKFVMNDYLAGGIFLELLMVSIHKYFFEIPILLLILLLGAALILIIIGLSKGRT